MLVGALAVLATAGSVAAFALTGDSAPGGSEAGDSRAAAPDDSPATSAPSATVPTQSAGPTTAAAPTALSDRTDCNQIRGTPYRSETEQQWFAANCQTAPGPSGGGQPAPSGGGQAAPSGDANAAFQRGLQLLNARDYAGAIVQFDQAIAIDPGHIEAHYNRGLAYFNSTPPQYDRAIADFTRVIELPSTQARKAISYLNRGVSYQRLGNHQQAVADLNQSITLEPNNPIAYEWRGRSYVALGNKAQACADFRKGLELATAQGVQVRIQALNSLISQNACP
jgi:tetratricopeptide (TPR) repeat protein